MILWKIALKIYLIYEVKYKRIYYKSKHTNEYKYLLDDFLNIYCHDRIDTSLKAELVEKLINIAYGKSEKEASKAIDRFHLNKYVLKATSLNPKYRFQIWEKMNNCDLKGLNKCFKNLIEVLNMIIKLKKQEDI